MEADPLVKTCMELRICSFGSILIHTWLIFKAIHRKAPPVIFVTAGIGLCDEGCRLLSCAADKCVDLSNVWITDDHVRRCVIPVIS